MIDRRLSIRALSVALVLAALVPSISLAQTAVEGMPALNVTTGADGETQYSLSLQQVLNYLQIDPQKRQLLE